ncbi:TetR/AcrR family transcriptional regulator C-terminal domain-containing protein [Proteus cibi]|uniref:TetR/AcrR family transcriptional regulator C-terminal domain-containing protein n=1 Tax=Proteus cibi TaxID=2050966 RepID=UPI0035A5B437
MKIPKIDRLKILDTAISLLESEGIEGLTMRKLADALQIKAASLYWHFDNKQTLIEGIADRIVSDVAVNFELTHHWQEDSKQLAYDLRNAFLRHRDGARVFAGTYVISENVLRINNTFISAIMQSGASAELASQMTMTLLYFILGCCIEQQSVMLIEKEEITNKREAFKQLVQDNFPQTWQARDVLFADDFTHRFDFGLEQLILGFQHQINES